MDLPQWITDSYLGNFKQDYSFDLNPILINFYASVGSKVSLLNGNLPIGLSWVQDPAQVRIYGASNYISLDTEYKFTFRIRQTDGTIADRTFIINLSALVAAPSWQNQPTFLGYQNNVEIATYQLTAIPPPGYHVFYNIASLSGNVTVDVTQNSGLLTVQGTSLAINPEISTINVSATSAGMSNYLDLTVELLNSSAGPHWYTPAGSLGNFIGGTYVEIQLVAEDPSSALISYSLQSYDQNWAIFLSPTGVVYGRLVKPISDITTVFTVIASTFVGQTARTFSITINPVATAGIISGTTPSDLGEIEEATQVVVGISATSTSSGSILYNVTGGILPPHLILGTTDGVIQGFCEYHAVSKIYYFDITASNGYQSITRQFKLSVKKIYSDQYFGIDIPLTGDTKINFANDVANVSIREPGTIIIDRLSTQEIYPTLTIIDGLVTNLDPPSTIINSIKPWLYQLDLNFGSAGNSAVLSNNTTLVYRNITDNQSNSFPMVNSVNSQPNIQIYPVSINNIRNALIGTYDFVSGGSGTGCLLDPVLDWSTGGLISVTVLNSGHGYLGAPNIEITGSGSSASAYSMLGIVSVKIENTGQSWKIGDEILITSGLYSTPARILVTNVGVNGEMLSIDILDQGNYQQVGSSALISIASGSATATIGVSWGVSSVIVDSAGFGYECSINVKAVGYELLPSWQQTYQPVVVLGTMNETTTSQAVAILNNEVNTIWGTSWQPNYVVFRWQGLNWLGKMSLDNDLTTFDGDTTRFEDSYDAYLTVFDSDSTVIDKTSTIFDYNDPIAYDLFQVWGSTVIDAGTTAFDLYSTIFDSLPPRRTSNTLLRKWIKTTHKTYTSNNAVW